MYNIFYTKTVSDCIHSIMSVTVLWGSHAVQPCAITNNLCVASYSLEKWSLVVAEPGGIIAMDIELFLQQEKRLPGYQYPPLLQNCLQTFYIMQIKMAVLK